MGDTAINVPVEIRTHEHAQSIEFAARLIERLRDIEMGEEADTIARIREEHLTGYEATPGHLSMPADDWRAFVSHLGRLRDEEGLRVWWLRKKLVGRLRDRMEDIA